MSEKVGLKLQKLCLAKIAGSLSIAFVLFASCSTLPYSSSKENTQSLTPNDLKRFNGDFNILTNDTLFQTLPYIFTYNNYFSPKGLPGECDRVRLEALGNNRLQVTVLNDSTIITKKVIKGRLSGNQFSFKVRKISPIYLILNGYGWQTNQLTLIENGSLLVDTKYGGLWFFTVIPTFGGRSQIHNLIFSRKTQFH
jgi:hypothetical protein